MEASTYYLLLTYGLTFVWILIFAARPEVRREMTLLGVLALFLLPVAFMVNVEGREVVGASFRALKLVDLLFSFVIAGISGTIFHAVFGKHYHRLPKVKRAAQEQKENLAQFWFLRLFLLFLVFVWSVVLLSYFFSLTIPIAVFLAALLVTVYLLSHRQDLFVDSLASGALTAFVTFTSAWIAANFAQIDFTIAPVVEEQTFLSVPVDLLLWSLALGLVLGPLYEFIRRLELTS